MRLAPITMILTTSLAVFLPLFVWLDSYSTLSIKTVFPLLGMWAYMLMWSHYIVGVVRRHNEYNYQPWREVTGWIVLALLLLHPGLILIDRISIPDYVGDNIRFIYLGVFALSAFLLWEAVTKLKSKFLEKYRPIWSAINDVAFIAIFFHGLNLGQHLQVGWFRTFWIITGIAAGISIIHNLVHDLKD